MKKLINYSVEKLEKLCSIPSPSGFTKKVTKYVFDELIQLGYTPEYTNKGNVVCCLGSDSKLKSPLMFAAHLDTLGLMVRSIKDNGRLRFTKIGGYANFNAGLENVTIYTRDNSEYTGTIQSTKPAAHVYGDTDKTVKEDKDLEVVIDENVRTKEDVEKLGIQVGDFIAFDPRTVVTKSGYIKSRHLDDKAGSVCLLALAKAVAEKTITLNRKVYIMFTVHEEVGHGGSAGIPDDVVDVISIDMGAIGDDLTCDETMVSICAKDSQGPYDYDITGKLINCAKAAKCDYAVDIYPQYGSDVDASLKAGHDIRHGLIGPGVFASHGYERTHIKGIKNTIKLLLQYVKTIDI